MNIKPRNIMLFGHGDKVLLIDVQPVRLPPLRLGDDETVVSKPTPPYAAPEVNNGTLDERPRSLLAADMFSVGMVLFWMFQEHPGVRHRHRRLCPRTRPHTVRLPPVQAPVWKSDEEAQAAARYKGGPLQYLKDKNRFRLGTSRRALCGGVNDATPTVLCRWFLPAPDDGLGGAALVNRACRPSHSVPGAGSLVVQTLGLL